MNYILYGEQYPMIKKKLNKLLKDSLGEIDEFNVTRFSMDEDDITDVINEMNFLPLGTLKKAVIMDRVDFLSKGAKKDIVDSLTSELKNDDSIDAYFIVRSGSIDENNKIVKFIKENGKIFAFLNLTNEQWPIYAKKYFVDHDKEIDDDAANELALRVDGDLNRFINEADKLCLYKDHIKLIDVLDLVSKPLEDDAFQISNALFRGDNASALAIYRDLKLFGSKATDSLIPMLGSQFRFISEVSYLYSKGLSNVEIANELNCHPYRVKMALQNSRRLSRNDIAYVLDNLYYLDYQIKSGQIDRFYGFELFLINFPN